jgi:hypothetical protein
MASRRPGFRSAWNAASKGRRRREHIRCNPYPERILNGTLTLHDIADVEAFCSTVARRREEVVRTAFVQAGRNFDHYAQQDYTAFLIAKCWEASLEYRPGGITFSTYAGYELRHHATAEFIRSELKRTVWKFSTHTYERPRPTLIPLDQLDHAEPASPGNHADDCLSDLARVLYPGGSKSTGVEGGRGGGSARQAA